VINLQASDYTVKLVEYYHTKALWIQKIYFLGIPLKQHFNKDNSKFNQAYTVAP